ncbi:hypothetical protein [Cognatitamlana onchidii]|uniref:hypothetical protein n=1 Tax=Cognatitamlana onchidii TaxID=2562860 RepID=UPI0010A6A390|nr:hypothetical protein [Algibacter onchidii]
MKKINLDNIKSSGFETPKGYFDTFDMDILNLSKEKQLLEKKTSGFKVPKTYFENIDNTILTQVSKKPQGKVIWFSQKTIIYVSGVAAAILILLNLSIFEEAPTFDNLETATVESYVLDDHFNSYEIASLLTDEQLSEDIIEHDLDENNLEAYLLDNADLELLMTE